MIRYPFSDKERKCNDYDREGTNPHHHTCIDRLERLLGRDILESIQEWEDEESVEVDQEKEISCWLNLIKSRDITEVNQLYNHSRA